MSERREDRKGRSCDSLEMGAQWGGKGPKNCRRKASDSDSMQTQRAFIFQKQSEINEEHSLYDIATGRWFNNHDNVMVPTVT